MKKITYADYNIVHDWIRRNYGSATKCANKRCLHKTARFNWALRHGKTHDKKIGNYIQLCVKCHKDYDKNTEFRLKVGGGVQIRVTPATHQKLRIAAATSGRYISDVVTELCENL